MKIVTVVGARPQFVKAAVVSRAIKAQNNRKKGCEINEVIVHTGQHYDKNMSEVFFEEMHIPKPNYYLNINGLSHGMMTGQMLSEIEKILMVEKPDWVLVYGDTNSTLAGSLAASKLHIPIAHVEAGLRSFNRRMPEEINRVITDHISTVLFCPTRTAVHNLKFEGIFDCDQRRVCQPGDVMLDAAHYYKALSRQPSAEIPENYILVTIHRAENTDDYARLENIFKAFEKIGYECPIIMPIHPRTRKIVKSIGIVVPEVNIQLIEPVSYFEMVYLLMNCNMVMTDSGGVQKEAYFFKKPCITLREETEWVELTKGGYNRLAGANTEKILDAYHYMKGKEIDYSFQYYGEGSVADKILVELESIHKEKTKRYMNEKS